MRGKITNEDEYETFTLIWLETPDMTFHIFGTRASGMEIIGTKKS